MECMKASNGIYARKMLTAAVLLAASFCVSSANAIESLGGCQYNCALQFEQIGSNYYLVARNSEGAIVALDAIDIPSFATPTGPTINEWNDQLASASSRASKLRTQRIKPAIQLGGSGPALPGSALQASSGDNPKAETSTIEYETPTHFIITAVVVVYSDYSNVPDVKTHTFTIPKPGQEIADPSQN